MIFVIQTKLFVGGWLALSLFQNVHLDTIELILSLFAVEFYQVPGGRTNGT